MDSNKVPIFEPGIRAVACANCQSVTKLKLQDDQLRCRDCNASYRIIDGVLDLMPPSYSGYQGDSMEAAALRDAHNRQALREDTAHLRSTFDQLLRPKALVLDAGCGTGHLAKIISKSHPDVTIIATDVSFPMCRLCVFSHVPACGKELLRPPGHGCTHPNLEDSADAVPKFGI
jgi:SAM-dependent methyltransferase